MTERTGATDNHHCAERTCEMRAAVEIERTSLSERKTHARSSLQAALPRRGRRYAVVPFLADERRDRGMHGRCAWCGAHTSESKKRSTHNHLRVLLGVLVLGDLDVDRGRLGLLLDRQAGVRRGDLLGNGVGALAARRGVDGSVARSVRNVSGLGLLESRARGRDGTAGLLGSGRLDRRDRGEHARRVRRVQASDERGPVCQWSSSIDVAQLTCCLAGRGCGASARP